MNVEKDFSEAIIRTGGRKISVLLTDVIVRRWENDAGGVQWELDLGISRGKPDEMEWSELDDLVHCRPELKFRINGEAAVEVDSVFGETDSRIGDRLPDISLGIDLTWHNIEGPIESVEALWVDGEGTQSLCHLLVRPVGYVPVPNHMEAKPEKAEGNGCGASVLLIILLLCSVNLVLVHLRWPGV